MSVSQTQLVIIQQIERLLAFLEPHLKLANCHMVDYFTQSCYENYLPKDVQTEIQNQGHKSAIDLIFKNDFPDAELPGLKHYINNSENFTLKNCTDICLSTELFIEKLKSWGCDNIDKLKLEIFMTPKKSHEVEILSAISASISKISNVSHLVDVGDGKGYLSSMIALHHKIPVLGIDASDINTCGAEKRANKLSRVWLGVKKEPNKSYPSKNSNTTSTDINLYKQVTQFVSADFDLEKLVADMFRQRAPLRLGLCGLHTCGNLAPNSIRIFTKHDYIKSICNVGCCYHSLTEKFDGDNSEHVGFPMSRLLTDKKLTIGRSARMIANHSVERILEGKELPNKTIYYRALLQVLFEKYCVELPTKHVGRFRKECLNFLDYSRKAIKRVDAKIDVTDKEIEQLNLEYESRIDELSVFYLLRSKLSPVIESLILLDRLLFLHEQGFEGSFVVQFFNPVISPRCYGIVALKGVL